MTEGDFEAAHRSLGEGGTIGDLHRIYGEASTLSVSTMKDAREALRTIVAEKAERLGTVEGRIAERELRLSQGVTYFRAGRRDAEERDAIRAEIATILRVKPQDLTLAAAKAAGRELPVAFREDFRSRHGRKCLDAVLRRHVEEVCEPAWKAEMALAREALSRPDYLAPQRPAVGEDPRTFEGFASSVGLRFSFERTKDRKDIDMPVGSIHYAWEMTTDQGSVSGRYSKGPAHASGLSREDVLQSLQSDFASAECNDVDDFLSEYGYAEGGAASLRVGRRAFEAITRQRESFMETFGEQAYRDLMTTVGDEPPLTEDHFERSPAPRM